MIGKHCFKALSKTQSMIAKSSGESELFGVINGSSETLGLETLAGDFGQELDTLVPMHALVDSRWCSWAVGARQSYKR